MDDIPSQEQRQAWLATLAHAPRDLLSQLVARCVPERQDGPEADFEWLRAPETGLTMVRARIANSGDRFNVGEVTLTRCAARYVGPDGVSSVGIGYVKGRDADRARWVAVLDALLQQPTHRERLTTDVLTPLRDATERLRTQERARTATSRVSFLTLQAEN